MDEGDAYRTLHDLYALDVGYSHIYKVTDGDFFNEYHKMTEGIRKDLELNHYIVLLDDHVIDIIGFDDPIVELE